MALGDPQCVLFEGSPQPAFAVESKLCFYEHFHAVLTCVSRLDGRSEFAFSGELRHFPYLRLQLAPQLRWSVRLPVCDWGNGRRFYIGTTGALTGQPEVDQPELLLEGRHDLSTEQRQRILGHGGGAREGKRFTTE